MIAAILITLIITIPIAFFWSRGIDKMNNDPDYKGEDFLDWDDDKFHTEDKL
jgi:hypothetical protein